MITDLQSEHFVDEKGALFPGALFLTVIIRLSPGGTVGKKQRIVLLAAVLASAFGFFLLILILQMVSFLVD
ncbi:hypothetical protein NKJ73_22350 [Mesorhizobium sp. M0074]|uniref:hypothetical protein n=1 Tax=unclassified Mesorhizobium TaxID=325217 RepID=UPI00333DC707